VEAVCTAVPPISRAELQRLAAHQDKTELEKRLGKTIGLKDWVAIRNGAQQSVETRRERLHGCLRSWAALAGPVLAVGGLLVALLWWTTADAAATAGLAAVVCGLAVAVGAVCAPQTGGGDGGFTMGDAQQSTSSWARAVAANGQSARGAWVAAAARLLLWHWLPPALYLLALRSYRDRLAGYQLFFASMLAAGQAAYLLATLAALVMNPAFLLVDLHATWRRGRFFRVALYALFPDIFVVSGLDWFAVLFGLVGGFCLTWFAGLLALAVAMRSPAGVVPALAVGYGVAAARILCACVFWCGGR
jgi:hypothetical protein